VVGMMLPAQVETIPGKNQASKTSCKEEAGGRRTRLKGIPDN